MLGRQDLTSLPPTTNRILYDLGGRASTSSNPYVPLFQLVQTATQSAHHPWHLRSTGHSFPECSIWPSCSLMYYHPWIDSWQRTGYNFISILRALSMTVMLNRTLLSSYQGASPVTLTLFICITTHRTDPGPDCEQVITPFPSVIGLLHCNLPLPPRILILTPPLNISVLHSL